MITKHLKTLPLLALLGACNSNEEHSQYDLGVYAPHSDLSATNQGVDLDNLKVNDQFKDLNFITNTHTTPHSDTMAKTGKGTPSQVVSKSSQSTQQTQTQKTEHKAEDKKEPTLKRKVKDLKRSRGSSRVRPQSRPGFIPSPARRSFGATLGQPTSRLSASEQVRTANKEEFKKKFPNGGFVTS